MAKRKLAAVAAVLALLVGATALWLGTTYGGNSAIWASNADDHNIAWAGQQQSGPVTVRIGTSREAGYRIGDIIPVQVVVIAQHGVVLDLGPLRSGTFSSSGEPVFELATQPKVEKLRQHGKDVYVISLDLRSWHIDPTLDFSVEIPYATRMKDGSLSWSSVYSPTLTVQTTRTAAKEDEFDPGNRNLVQGKPQTIAPVLKFTGTWIVIGLLAFLALHWLPKRRKERAACVNKRAWELFEHVFMDAHKNGWSVDHYSDIAGRLRLVMGVQSVDLHDLPTALAGRDEEYREAALRAFALLQDALYAKRELSGIERAQLETDLDVLVPRVVA